MIFMRVLQEIKKVTRQSLNQIGYDISRLPTRERLHLNLKQMGRDPFADMSKFLSKPSPIVFDIGANEGQSIQSFRHQFPSCIIYSFEPSPTTFAKLSKNTQGLAGVHLSNCALGSAAGQMTLMENSGSDMSSFLPLGNSGWGKIVKETTVEVKTVDEFARDKKIQQIDILKTDTQGFDLEVLKGSDFMLRNCGVGLIYLEITFAELYKNLPSIGSIFDFMTGRDFYLVSFYKFYYRKNLMAWTDALFVHQSYMPTNV